MKAALLSIAVLTSLAAPAAADDSGATKREADRHFKTGVKLFEETKYSEALAEFEQAYALASHPLLVRFETRNYLADLLPLGGVPA